MRPIRYGDSDDAALVGAHGSRLALFARLGMSIPLGLTLPVGTPELHLVSARSAPDVLGAQDSGDHAVRVRLSAPTPLAGLPAPVIAGPAAAAAELATATVGAVRQLYAATGSRRVGRALRAQGVPNDQAFAVHIDLLPGAATEGRWGIAASRTEDGAPGPAGWCATGICPGVAPAGRSGAGSGTVALDSAPIERAPLADMLAALEAELLGAVEVVFESMGWGPSLVSGDLIRRPTAPTRLRVIVDLARQGTILPREAVRELPPELAVELRHPVLRPTGDVLARGLAVSPGVGVGLLALSRDRVAECAAAGVPAVLVCATTGPADVDAIRAAAAVVTIEGGLTSHAAIVTRAAGTPAVAGARDLVIDREHACVSANGIRVQESEPISVDGRAGTVYAGVHEVLPAPAPAGLDTVLDWADGLRTLGVRANADNARDARAALGRGADGVGLCRTEHQFLGPRLPLIQAFLTAADERGEAAALRDLRAAQLGDFRELLAELSGRPLIVRLLDAPLHEFLGTGAREVNPMLGVRGARLAVLRDGLYQAQSEALFTAWAELDRDGASPELGVMIPMVSLPGELAIAAAQIARAAEIVERESGIKPRYQVGSMIETPRAALLAGELARTAEFLSFGTNDLTQMTYGFSRDDVERKLLDAYAHAELLEASPFLRLDMAGVGQLMRLAIDQARAVRPGITIGLCGEHGGDAQSIEACASLGLDYVSCSPGRIEFARLAAARAAVS